MIVNTRKTGKISFNQEVLQVATLKMIWWTKDQAVKALQDKEAHQTNLGNLLKIAHNLPDKKAALQLSWKKWEQESTNISQSFWEALKIKFQKRLATF